MKLDFMNSGNQPGWKNSPSITILDVLIVFISVFLLMSLVSFTPINSGSKLSMAALERTTHRVSYNGKYIRLTYPNGDVPDNLGVCTDVVIRSYRNAFNIDFQQLIYEDKKANVDIYPRLWEHHIPDYNIDHRRTQNMECFLTRKGAKLPITNKASDYKPGDLVFWDIAAGHVGIVVDKYVNGRPMVVHNIGGGPRCEDFLFSATITGHYRWLP